MLSETQKATLLKEMKEEVHNNPNQTYYGLYKDYSGHKGKIYKQQDNMYLIITSSDTYTRHLENIGYRKALLYKPSNFRDGKIMRLE